MYKVRGVGPSGLVNVPNSNDLHFNTMTMGILNIHGIRVIRDLPSKLRLERPAGSAEAVYSLRGGMDADWPYESLLPEWSGPMATGSIGVSPNGRWMAIEAMDVGLLLMDMRTRDIKLFSDFKFFYGVRDNGERKTTTIQFVVSDSGKYVMAFDFYPHIQPKIYTISDNCVFISKQVESIKAAAATYTSCPDDRGKVEQAIAEYYNQGLGMIWADCFAENGDVLIFRLGRTMLIGDRYENVWFDVPLHSGNYRPTYRLDYLAMGDSISSGEGDVEKNPTTKKKYYRDHTDAEEDKKAGRPREKCHLSTRSYPYLLAGWMGLSRDKQKTWDSVACSGATSDDVDAPVGDGVYEGQAKGASKMTSGDGDDPRLKGYSNIAALQNAARNEMIPGRIEQIEFVEKYQPKVVTITMGANDIDFGGKLQACLWTGECEWATTKRSTMARQIQNEYDVLKTKYESIHSASGDSAKVYVLGYPHIISGDKNAKCKGNIGMLDASEREMIVSATNYLNKVIERAANAAGVQYVNVAHALDGNKLCEGDSLYMNGVTDFMGVEGTDNASQEVQESFHPNDYGQIRIANVVKKAVKNESLITYDVCKITTDNTQDSLCPRSGSETEKPPVTDFAGVTEEPATDSKNKKMTSATAKKGTSTSLSAEKYSFAPNSEVSTELHSDPVGLGSLTALEDGSLSANIDVPTNVPAGYHTLVLSGATYSGEPIQYTQTLLVTGTSESDLDENGKKDSLQACGPFLIELGIDSDEDGIDDACDAQIGQPVASGQNHIPDKVLDVKNEKGSKPFINSMELYRKSVSVNHETKYPDDNSDHSNNITNPDAALSHEKKGMISQLGLKISLLFGAMIVICILILAIQQFWKSRNNNERDTIND